MLVVVGAIEETRSFGRGSKRVIDEKRRASARCPLLVLQWLVLLMLRVLHLGDMRELLLLLLLLVLLLLLHLLMLMRVVMLVVLVLLLLLLVGEREELDARDRVLGVRGAKALEGDLREIELGALAPHVLNDLLLELHSARQGAGSAEPPSRAMRLGLSLGLGLRLGLGLGLVVLLV